MAGSVLRIPHFIQSRSPSGLRRRMLETQAMDGMEYEFRDITVEKGVWTAWYLKLIAHDEAFDERFETAVKKRGDS